MTYTCFVAMPISTPGHLVSQYGNDPDHFAHLLGCLIRPALEAAGFEVVEPSMRHGEFIHAEVIKNLEQCDLVLCDISTLNANVFMELGIRTALNRPIALIRDEFTGQVPFDTQVIGYHVYNSNLAQWVVCKEIPKLSEFAKSVLEKSGDKNALWRYLGMTRSASEDISGHMVPGALEFILKEAQMREESKPEPSMIIIQKIVKLSYRHKVTLLSIKWESQDHRGPLSGVAGAYEILIAPTGLDARSALQINLEEIGEQFGVDMSLLEDE